MPIQNIGNDVLRAFLSGAEEARQARALTARTQEQKDRLELEKKQHEDTLAQAERHFNANLALSKAMKDIQMLEARQKLAKDFAESGVAPAGTQVTESNTTTPEQDMEGLNRASSRGFNPVTGETGVNFSGEAGPATNRTIDVGGEIGKITVPDPFSYARQRADQARILNAPKEESAIRTAKGIAEVKAPFAQQLEQMKLDAQANTEIQKFKAKQLEQASKFNNDIALVRLRATLRPSPGANAKARESNAFLSPEDAIKLNVPYGTTKGEAARMNITPEKPRSAQEQARLDGFIALRNDLTSLYASGENSKWSEHKPVLGGVIGSVKNKTGLMDTQAGADYRSKMGRINADYIHSTYGSVFSKNEQELANTWLPSLSEASGTSRSKLKGGIDHLTQQIDLLLGPSKVTRRGTDSNLRRVFTDPKTGQKVNTISKDGGLTFEEE